MPRWRPTVFSSTKKWPKAQEKIRRFPEVCEKTEVQRSVRPHTRLAEIRWRNKFRRADLPGLSSNILARRQGQRAATESAKKCPAPGAGRNATDRPERGPGQFRRRCRANRRVRLRSVPRSRQSQYTYRRFWSFRGNRLKSSSPILPCTGALSKNLLGTELRCKLNCPWNSGNIP